VFLNDRITAIAAKRLSGGCLESGYEVDSIAVKDAAANSL